MINLLTADWRPRGVMSCANHVGRSRSTRRVVVLRRCYYYYLIRIVALSASRMAARFNVREENKCHPSRATTYASPHRPAHRHVSLKPPPPPLPRARPARAVAPDGTGAFEPALVS